MRDTVYEIRGVRDTAKGVRLGSSGWNLSTLIRYKD